MKYLSLILFISIFLVQSSQTVFWWIIVQDDKNSISSRSYSYESNFFIKMSREGIFVNEIYSYICLCVFPVLWHFEKIIPQL